MYTHGPGSNIAPRSATAITDIAFGRLLAVRPAPSTGSTAMSTSGPEPDPTCSPAYSIGVSSFSPSPMTITPRIAMVPRTGRIASTAAPSTSSSSPRPRNRTAAIAAASVARTSSSVRMRSSSRLAGTRGTGSCAFADRRVPGGPSRRVHLGPLRPARCTFMHSPEWRHTASQGSRSANSPEQGDPEGLVDSEPFGWPAREVHPAALPKVKHGSPACFDERGGSGLSGGVGGGKARRWQGSDGRARMATTLFLVTLVIVTALFFDFTNGFHDSANAMATSVATGALTPKVAVLIAAVLNVVGAFLSTEVAKTISGGIVNDAPGHPDDDLRRAGRRHPVEPDDLAVRPAVQLVARPVRRADRRRADRRRRLRRQLLGRRLQDPAAGDHRAAGRRAGRRAGHLPALQDDQAGRPGTGEPAGSAGRRPCPRRWSRWRTAPPTGRRRWA